jgi:hypothetical protein
MKHVDDKYKYSELTSKIIGCAIEVHKILGNGFPSAAMRLRLSYSASVRLADGDAGSNISTGIIN